ncbi:class I SAM-dependent methyltransferase [Bacillus marinisedimentorum]|uniref:class I SAM-dependent methyltransferase n=1 Tax=Bacillus marinisedimentorum TaxID=1821260 RepID=UPI00087258C5|nr:class I SAM-dependent methyltransferase [Bacillus marinisedimentorum]
METGSFYTWLLSEAEKPFAGWNFEYVAKTGRMDSELLPWSYASKILPLIKEAQSMLDMGTGGGEFLTMMQPLPAETHATEGYAPNVQEAAQQLEPLGVHVHAIDQDEHLPFEDRRFDLIINRHESYHPEELFRILKPGGLFVTQQVGGKDNLEINRMLGVEENFGYGFWNKKYAVEELKLNGFDILQSQEAYPAERFYDVGALVYYLKAIPWQIPDFSVEAYLPQLEEIHTIIERTGYFECHAHRFFIMARKK